MGMHLVPDIYKYLESPYFFTLQVIIDIAPISDQFTYIA
jgi:hypothetical protein